MSQKPITQNQRDRRNKLIDKIRRKANGDK